MKYICLNPRLFKDKSEMLFHIAEKAGIPSERVKNLDALYDELTACFTGMCFLCLRYEKEGKSLYPYADGVYRAVKDAARENDTLRAWVVCLPAL